MAVVQIDIIRLQPLEALLDRGAHIRRIIVGGAVTLIIGSDSELGSKEDLTPSISTPHIETFLTKS